MIEEQAEGGQDATASSKSGAGTPAEPRSDEKTKSRRARTPRPFPASSFMEALPLADAIQRFAAGHKIRRLTLFENLGRSAESGASRQLITNSNQYGLTKGGYNAEYLELTEDGRLASGDDSLGRARLAARLELAIARIEPFNALYERCRDNRLPTLPVLRDFVIEHGVPDDKANECVETFLANARDLHLVRNYAGAERMLTFDLLLEEMEAGTEIDLESRDDTNDSDLEPPVPLRAVPSFQASSAARVLAETSDLSNVCFLISPIGAEGTEQRKHANLVLGSLLEPAIESLGLRLVRADKISNLA